MIWNDIKPGNKFKDSSILTQRHQTHDYDCYKITYEDVDGSIKTLIASRDHLLKVNISTLQEDVKSIIKEKATGMIPIKEDIYCEVLGYIDEDKKKLVYSYVSGLIDKSVFKSIEDISKGSYECYLITFLDDSYKEVFVKRKAIEEEPQKIDEDHYWIPLEGIHWIFEQCGECDILC